MNSSTARRFAAYTRDFQIPIPRSLRARLSLRQCEVAIYIADGLHNKAIAARLKLAPQTVRLYSARIYRHLRLVPDPERDPRDQIRRAVIDAWADEETAA